MRTFLSGIGKKLRPQAEQVIEHTLSALLTVCAIAGLHAALRWIVTLSGAAHDGGHELLLWDLLPVRYLFDAGHFAVLLRWVVNCVRVAWQD